MNERVCDDCREPLDADGCLHNVDRPYCRDCIGNCAECRADLADDYAAELSMDRGL